MNNRTIFTGLLVILLCLDLAYVLFLLVQGFNTQFLTIIKSQALFLAFISVLSFLHFSSRKKTISRS